MKPDSLMLIAYLIHYSIIQIDLRIRLKVLIFSFISVSILAVGLLSSCIMVSIIILLSLLFINAISIVKLIDMKKSLRLYEAYQINFEYKDGIWVGIVTIHGLVLRQEIPESLWGLIEVEDV
jgi:hypothetical protein